MSVELGKPWSEEKVPEVVRPSRCSMDMLEEESEREETLHVLEYDPVRGGAWTVKHAGPCPAAFLRQIGAKRDGHRRASEKVAPVEKEAG